MRKRFAALLVALALGATTGLTAIAPTPVGALAEGVVDVAVEVDVVSVDGTNVVSPPGSHALYTLQGYNKGVVPVSAASVSIELPAGSAYAPTPLTAACSASGTVVTCPTGPLPIGGSKTYEIAASTPPTAGTYTVTGRIQEHDAIVSEPLEYTANNTKTTTLDVAAAKGPGSYGLVLGGGSISYQHPTDGRRYELQVPASSPGVIVSIEPDDGVFEGTPRQCGEFACGKGFHTDFVDHPYFRADVPTDPIVTKRTYGVLEPCRGLGGNCTEIYFAKAFDDTTLEPMPGCSIAGQAAPDPCLAKKYKTTAGAVWFDVLMTSTDPLDIPPLLL